MTRERNMRYRRWNRWVRREIAAGRDFRHGFILSGNLTAGSEFYRLPVELEQRIKEAEAHPERRAARPELEDA